jgi:dipeptidyl aminopeptidase/acylaminoacyl peptidase
LKEDNRNTKYREALENTTAYQIQYDSMWNSIEWFIVIPNEFKSKVPVIIRNRGGTHDFFPIDDDWLCGRMWDLALEWYCVIATQYSAWPNSEWVDQYWWVEINDVISLYQIIQEVEQLDESDIHMIWWSRWWMMTYLALRKVDRLKSVCVIAWICNYRRLVALRPWARWITTLFPQNEEEFSNRSVVDWVEELKGKAPILIVHWTHDERVSPLDPLELSKKFIDLQIPHRLVMLEWADHWHAEFRSEVAKMCLNWINKYSDKGK